MPIHLKINLSTVKAINFQHPPSLWNILREDRNIPHNLRPTQAFSLSRPYTKGFGIQANPKLWNLLPKTIRCAGLVLAFCIALKI